MVRWYDWLSGHEFEQIWGDGEGQGSLVCCSPWGRKESDMTQQVNNSNDNYVNKCHKYFIFLSSQLKEEKQYFPVKQQ